MTRPGPLLEVSESFGMPILSPSQVELVPISEFERLYYGFPYGFETQVKKLLDTHFLCEAPIPYARFLQRVAAPTWLMTYAPEETADPFRRRMTSVLQACNADIAMVPEAQRGSALAEGLRNKVRFSHHTKGKQDQTWHYKVAYLPGFYHFDREGFSGWSELANATPAAVDNIPREQAEQFFTQRLSELLTARRSKYTQDEKIVFAERDFIFVALQIPDDSVIQLGHSGDYVRTMRDAIRAMLSRGLRVVAKRHPLCTHEGMAAMLRAVQAEGCLVTQASVHQILPAAKAVVTLNSGVGFEALLYLKPVVCLGRSDYSLAGWHVSRPEELEAALVQAFEGKSANFIKQFLFLALKKYQLDLSDDLSAKQHALRALCWNYLNLSRA